MRTPSMLPQSFFPACGCTLSTADGRRVYVCPDHYHESPAAREAQGSDAVPTVNDGENKEQQRPRESSGSLPDVEKWKCMARPTSDPPSDCDWPSCGCDPYANKVLTALEEAAPGLFGIERDNQQLRADLQRVTDERDRIEWDLCGAQARATVAEASLSSLRARMQEEAQRLAEVNQGFELESLNGVVCSIPDSGIDTRPTRTWCARCQDRYKKLRDIEARLSALIDPLPLPEPPKP